MTLSHADFAEGAAWHRMVATNLAADEMLPLNRNWTAPVTLLDCGANRGLWTQGFLEAFPETEVDAHLFEPSSRNCEFIRNEHQAIFGNRRPGHTITVNELAVGSDIGILELHSDWDGSWLASLADRGDIGHANKQSVSVTTIDSYCAERRLSTIDMLKIDVEGWEFAALSGAGTMLASRRVKNILFEFSHANVYSRVFFFDFWNLLSPLGYNISLLADRKLYPVTEYGGQWERHAGTSNYFAALD